MTTQKLEEIKKEMLPTNLAGYLFTLKIEAETLGKSIPGHATIKQLEALALDDDNLISTASTTSTPTSKGSGDEGAGNEGQATKRKNAMDELFKQMKESKANKELRKELQKHKEKEEDNERVHWDELEEWDENNRNKEEIKKIEKEIKQAEMNAKEQKDTLQKKLEEAKAKLEEALKKKKEREERERKEKETKEKTKGTHKQLDMLLDTLKVQGLAYLVGAAGTGKTSLAMDACAVLFGKPKDDWQFAEHWAQISFSPDTTSSEMIGRVDVNGNFHRSDIVRVFAEGGVILFDEIDNADASMLVKLNTAIANGTIATPNGLVRRHKDTYIVCTANTFGTGATAMYVGRTRLDTATLDRFVCATIEVDYDRDLEDRIMSVLPDDKHDMLKQFVSMVRRTIEEKKLRRVCSTRFVIAGTRWLLNGKTKKQVEDMFFVGWTEGERKACYAP